MLDLFEACACEDRGEGSEGGGLTVSISSIAAHKPVPNVCKHRQIKFVCTQANASQFSSLLSSNKACKQTHCQSTLYPSASALARTEVDEGQLTALVHHQVSGMGICFEVGVENTHVAVKAMRRDEKRIVHSFIEQLRGHARSLFLESPTILYSHRKHYHHHHKAHP